MYFYYVEIDPVIVSWIIKFFEHCISIIIAVMIGFILLRLRDTVQKMNQNRKACIQGIMIFSAFKEEILNAEKSFDEVHNIKVKPIEYQKVPIGMWSGIQTVPDYVLNKLYDISKNDDNTKEDRFKAVEAISHIKNYYVHVGPNWNNFLDVRDLKKKAGTAQEKLNSEFNLKYYSEEYLEASRKLLKTIDVILTFFEKEKKKGFWRFF